MGSWSRSGHSRLKAVMPMLTEKNVLRPLLSKLRRVRKAKSVGVMNTSLIYISEWRSLLHLHLKDAILSSSPMGRTRQGGPHAGAQGDPVLVNGGTQEGPGLKTTPDLWQHHRRLPYRGSRTSSRRRGTSPSKVSPSHCGEIPEGDGHNLTLFCNIYCSTIS